MYHMGKGPVQFNRLDRGKICDIWATMNRYALKVEYHGAPFAGWQRQADQPSVQGAIEDALAKLEPRAHTIAAAGRTDAGAMPPLRLRTVTWKRTGIRFDCPRR